MTESTKITKKKSKNALKREKFKLLKAKTEQEQESRVLGSLKAGIEPKNLNFDCERVCSVTLETLNLYMCLTCGSILKGHSINTPAYNHALHSVSNKQDSTQNEDLPDESRHRLFINLKDSIVYLLPESKKVDTANEDDLLNLIRLNCNPKIQNTDIKTREAYTTKTEYYPGYAPIISNSQNTDYINVIVFLFSRIKPILQTMLLNEELKCENQTLFEQAFINFLEKIWNPHLLKPCVSNMQFIDYLNANHSALHDMPNDPKLVYMWFINNFKNKIITQQIDKCLQGDIQIIKTPIDLESLLPNGKSSFINSPFKILTLDLPASSVFKERNLSSVHDSKTQETLILKDLINQKFSQTHIAKNAQYQQQYKILKHPEFLVLHFNRFPGKDMNETEEKRNKTLIEFETENVELFPGVKYNLVYNVFYSKGKFKSDLKTDEKQFLELDGLKYKKKDSNLLFLQESYMQLWERQKDTVSFY